MQQEKPTTGTLEGALREFGGETLVVFGDEGMDEMDFINGSGWLQLAGSNTLEGEFVGGLGRFEAKRSKSLGGGNDLKRRRRK